jgi:hypothetical protein
MEEYSSEVPQAFRSQLYQDTGTRCGPPIIDIEVFVEQEAVSILPNSAGNDEGSSDSV